MALTTSLIGYWKLDEASGNDAIDAHGTNTLTQVNTVGAATGKINNGRDFEFTSGHHFTHASNSDLQVGDIDFTIAGWVNFESVGGAGSGLFSKWDGVANQYGCDAEGASQAFRFYVNDGSSTVIVTSAILASTATWYYVVCWHDSGANTINIQINDGTVDSLGHSTGVQASSSAEFWLGDRQGGGDQLDGILDEVGFWKRVLTSGERTSLYNGGAGLSYDSFAAADTGPSVVDALTLADTLTTNLRSFINVTE